MKRLLLVLLMLLGILMLLPADGYIARDFGSWTFISPSEPTMQPGEKYYVDLKNEVGEFIAIGTSVVEGGTVDWVVVHFLLPVAAEKGLYDTEAPYVSVPFYRYDFDYEETPTSWHQHFSYLGFNRTSYGRDIWFYGDDRTPIVDACRHASKSLEFMAGIWDADGDQIAKFDNWDGDSFSAAYEFYIGTRRLVRALADR